MIGWILSLVGALSICLLMALGSFFALRDIVRTIAARRLPAMVDCLALVACGLMLFGLGIPVLLEIILNQGIR
jgi:hypothetical protein